MPHRTVDYTVRRTLAYVSLPGQFKTGRARWNITAPFRSARDNIYVSVGKHHKPYARSVHNSAYLTHKVKGVLLVWRYGRLLTSVVIFNCNQRSWKFEFVDSQPEKNMCQYCLVENINVRPRKEEQ